MAPFVDWSQVEALRGVEGAPSLDRVEVVQPVSWAVMVAVALPLVEIEARLARWDGRMSVAAVNGPSSVVVAGDPGALEELVARCVAEGVTARMIPVDYASHTSQVGLIRDDLVEVLAGLKPGAAQVPFFSRWRGGGWMPGSWTAVTGIGICGRPCGSRRRSAPWPPMGSGVCGGKRTSGVDDGGGGNA